MAFILSKKNGRLNTIKGELTQYTKEILILAVIVIITGIYIFYVMTLEIATGSERIFTINDFYSEIQAEQKLLYDFVTEQDMSLYSEIYLKSDKLLETIEEIASFQVTADFMRDIQDIYKILQQYQCKIKSIKSCIESGTSFREISAEFYEAEHMSTLISGTFQSVNQQITVFFQQYITAVKKKCFLCSVVLLWIIFLFTCYLSWCIHGVELSIMNPIQILMNKLRKMSISNFEDSQIIEEIDGVNDDIKLLIEVYNSMVAKIQKQFSEQEEYANTKLKLKEQELLNLQISNELKKSQMTSLQSQMNPHFLFNTLNMVSHTAYMENAMETVGLLQITSDLLRYALDYSDKTVSLKKEIEQLGNYVYLQEKRFGERIRFQFDLDESFHDVKVPNLILQPLVENAVSHGVGMYTHGGEITIFTQYLEESKQGRISVIDNGEGMNREMLEKVKYQMYDRQDKSGKIGLNNVYFRLDCFFEQHAEIIISSVPKVRTEVTILIPCDRGKEGEINGI